MPVQKRKSIVSIYLFALVAMTLVSKRVEAYPEFIGYGYTSCLTCHFNSQGNGPLNDYGRALWSAEIASRALAGKTTDDELGEKSGFLFGAPQPWWLKPSLKGRVLRMATAPGGAGSQRNIVMQAEGSIGLLFDEEQKWMVLGTFGYVPVPEGKKSSPNADKIDTWISREHYVRWHAKKDLWVYVGMMDRVYGIRIVDHTAYSRVYTGMQQNDQSHGVVLHYIQPKYELTVNGFVGNLYQQADLRQMGLSLMAEYEPREAWRIGASLLNSQNKYLQNRRVGFHSKKGFGGGSSLLVEVGTTENLPVKTVSNSLGYYFYSEAMQKLTRGYHIYFSAQASKDSFDGASKDRLRYGVGMLMFPIARAEVRVDLDNFRALSYDFQRKDTWLLTSQIHLSF